MTTKTKTVARTETKPVAIAGSERFDLPSTILGRSLRILVAKPYGDMPKAGWPAVYLLDGFDMFPIASQCVRQMASAGETRAAVVVGVAYAEPKTGGEQRWRDLSTPVSQAYLDRQGRKDVTAEGVGGMDDFLRAIHTEVKPAVAAMLKVNAKDQTLFGHSLGGLTVLRALFRRTGDYRTFLASSPSIWWDDRAILADEAAFSAKVEAGRSTPRVFVSVGADEGRAGKVNPASGRTQADVERMTRQAKMVGNARALSARLKALRGGAGYVVESVVFPEEGHLSVVPAAVSRGLRFALRNDG